MGTTNNDDNISSLNNSLDGNEAGAARADTNASPPLAITNPTPGQVEHTGQPSVPEPRALRDRPTIGVSHRNGEPLMEPPLQGERYYVDRGTRELIDQMNAEDRAAVERGLAQNVHLRQPPLAKQSHAIEASPHGDQLGEPERRNPDVDRSREERREPKAGYVRTSKFRGAAPPRGGRSPEREDVVMLGSRSETNSQTTSGSFQIVPQISTLQVQGTPTPLPTLQQPLVPWQGNVAGTFQDPQVQSAIAVLQQQLKTL